ncbi:ribonucleotide reductase [Litchfieldella anticariensis FP35 = DSM 16096]|uniref:Ribonucleoside-diphosphate reductase n=1 Tax=Litchfieldella anticariensis (strain DSM 16096 / CECT 5854 / CIP 108499 / LMG 22089 / FP35) TaxID=1121939 RepID=S2KJP8_LITA3|nr:LAGLIDADG family homing endonuclease [Halomonas anticariensis]EPC00633.1 ribonucleotide reductase [Halomonas anticariensis FP35 = DSM 16096]
MSTSAKAAKTSNEVPMQAPSRDIWDSKYRLKDRHGRPVDKDFHATFERVAQALAAVEGEQADSWLPKFRWALENGAIPAGRILSNAGADDYKPSVSLINCTVSRSIHDSMHDILSSVVDAGMTLKAGCGIGYEFSTLRHKGAFVFGAGAGTNGPLAFMDIFDKMCFTVASAGGRRGAQMGTFDVGHPDVEAFIEAKREPGRLRQFNLSLLITDEFMEAVRDDADWPLAFPLHSGEKDDVRAEDLIYRDWPVIEEGYSVDDEGRVACRVVKTIKARELWDTIMGSTYDYAEPGFVLIDQVNRLNNNWFCEEIRATNPCVTADTWVQTSEGPRQVADLVGLSFDAVVDGESHRSGPQGFFLTAKKPVVRLRTAEGYSLKLTSDHRVCRVSAFTRYRTETEWCPAGELRQGDRVLLNDHRAGPEWAGNLTEDQGYLLGLLVGDGTLKTDKAILSVWADAAVVNDADSGADTGVRSVMALAEKAARSLPHRADFSGWQKINGRNEFRLSTSALRELALDMGMQPGNKAITPILEKASSSGYVGFLRGFFDADGSVQGTQAKGVSVRLAQSDMPRLEAVQRMLLRLGIVSTIYRDRRNGLSQLLPDGRGGHREYALSPQHELVITGENLERFVERIGFGDSKKQGRLEQLLGSYRRGLNRERFIARVVTLEEVGVEAVYDVQVPGINEFDANGFHAHNCGEQPLPPEGACLLGSVNLTRFVIEPFSDNPRFDWERYRKVVAIFTRMLDNVVEISGLPLPGQRRELEAKRRHGMGFLGLGSTLAMLKIPYGSQESLDFTDEVSKVLAIEGWKQALELSREKGMAPVLAEEFEITPKMLRERPELAKDGYEVGDKVPGRILHTRYSRYMQKIAEVEPELVAALAEHGARFTHHSSIAPTGTISLSLGNNASNGIEPSFSHRYFRNVIQSGKKTKAQVEVVSFELAAYRHFVAADAVESDLPDYFVTADAVTPEQHVAVQAAAQAWIDSAISKTVNVPTDFPFEQFKDLYQKAYDSRLKGCTTFRFNPEAFQGVLVREDDLKNTTYVFELENGETLELKGDEKVIYEGEEHTAANLYDAIKEGTYGKW